MKNNLIYFVALIFCLGSGRVVIGQNSFQLISDTIKITGSKDTGELVIRNRTRGTNGVLFNKGEGTTEFRPLKFIRIGDSTLLIFGQDTTVMAGSGGATNVYAGDPDVLLYALNTGTNNMKLRWWKSNIDLYESPTIGVIGDSQGKGEYPSSYAYSIIGRLQNFIYSVANNAKITNYCQNGYNSRKLAPNGSNPYVDNQHNVTKALADGNKIILLCNTSNDFSSSGAGGITTIKEAMENTLLIADACNKAGATLFVVSSFPRTQADRAQWDSLQAMASMLNLKFENRCAYVYHLLEDPANPEKLNPSLQVGDDIHLNDGGSYVVYSAIRDMLTSYFVSNTNVSKYEVQRAKKMNSGFSFLQYQATPNEPSLTIPKDSDYYRVRLVYQNGYYSKWSNIVQGVAALGDSVFNQPPLVVVTQPQLIFLPSNSVSLNASASDPNNNGTISSYNWFKSMGNVASITSPTSAATTVTGLVEGTYVFRCQVTNNSNISSYADATVTVVYPDSNNTAAKFNFNNAAQNVAGWVDVSGGPLNPNNNGGVWTDNQHSISLVNVSNSTSVWGTDFYGNSSNTNGQPTPDAGGYLIPQSVIATSWYANSVYYAGPATDQMKITGLNPAKKYKLKFFSSLNTNFGLNANPTVFIVNDNQINQKQVNSIGNTSNVVIFRGISPNVNGEIRFFVGSQSGISQFGILNALTVQADSITGTPIPPSVSSGGDKVIQLPSNSIILSASAADANGELVSITWSQISGPGAANIGSPSTYQTAVSNLSEGVYVFRCTASDNYGLNGHADIQVTVKPGSVNPMIYVCVSKNQVTESGWSGLVGLPNAIVLTDSARLGSLNKVVYSTVSTANWTPFLGSFAADQTGETIDDGGGFAAPARIVQGNFFNVNAYDVNKPQIRLTGLPAGIYTVTMFGSLVGSFVNANGLDVNTEYRINGGAAQTVNASGNTSHVAKFTGVQVDTGVINLYFNPTVGNTTTKIGLLNFFTIEKTN